MACVCSELSALKIMTLQLLAIVINMLDDIIIIARVCDGCGAGLNQ